jgi:tRNA dimethylallyltransferase
MYVKALTHGLEDLPGGDAALREEMSGKTMEELSQWLLRLDPGAAAAVNLRNPRHVQRAIEISVLTGRPASEWKRQWRERVVRKCGIFVNPDRDWLRSRIAERTADMFRRGVVEEVAALQRLSATAEKAIGLAEIRSLLGGEMSRAEAMAAIALATQRYAKRQVTWFKREECFVPVRTPDEARHFFGAIPQFQ